MKLMEENRTNKIDNLPDRLEEVPTATIGKNHT